MSNEFTIKVSIAGEGYDSGFEIEVDREVFGLEEQEKFEEFVKGLGEMIFEYLLNRAQDG
jgi:hypothetical protein